MPGVPMPRVATVPGPKPGQVVGKRLHPLHSAEWLSQIMLDTGCYPDTERCTGRTTILALSYIVKALQSPHEVIEVRDHHPTTHCHAMLVKLIHDMAGRLGLQGMLCNPSRLTVQFTNPIEKPTAY